MEKTIALSIVAAIVAFAAIYVVAALKSPGKRR